MKRIVCWGVIVGVTTVVSFAALSQSQGGDVQKQTLAGLSGVTVLVAELNPELKDFGLTTWALKAHVQSRLKENGIPVSPQSTGQPKSGFLVVEIHADTRQSSALCALRYDVMFMQPVRLVSNGSLVVPAETWAKRGVKLVRASLLAQTATAEVSKWVEQFASDYLTANGPS